MWNKRGLQLTFGMIFSIIIIIAIVGVSFYAINYFLNLGKCTEISLFYQDFQKEVDKAWNSEITKETYIGNLPRKIESVCFLDREPEETTVSFGVGEEYEVLEDYFRIGGNMFIYPPEETCNQVYKTVQHIDVSELDGWHCFPVRENRVEIPIDKGSFDALVKVKKN
jgi:hypothetical protein